MRHVFIVLVWYDVALTFATEVQRIWRRRFSGATIIYLIIRYTMLLQSTLYVVTVVLYHSSDKVSALKIFPPTHMHGSTLISNAQQCVFMDNSIAALNILGFLGLSLFTIVRVYAIWDRDWRPLIVVAPLALFRPAIYAVSLWLFGALRRNTELHHDIKCRL